MDPWADPEELYNSYGLHLVPSPEPGIYDGILLAVPHRKFVNMSFDHIRPLARPHRYVLYDLKGILARNESDLRL